MSELNPEEIEKLEAFRERESILFGVWGDISEMESIQEVEKYLSNEINKIREIFIKDIKAMAEMKKVNIEMKKDMDVLVNDGKSFSFDKMDDMEALNMAVCEILQFLEYRFPNALDIIDRPIQRTIFQNYRYRLTKRLHKKIKD